MKWFKKRKGLDFEIISKDVPITSLMRWFLYDTGLIEPNEIASRLNLTPVSEEGDIKEEEDSNNRIEAISDLLPFIELMAQITADVVTAIQVKDIENSLEEQESQIAHELTVMRQMYKVVALSALLSTFSAAVELDIISTDAIENMRMEEGYFDEQ